MWVDCGGEEGTGDLLRWDGGGQRLGLERRMPKGDLEGRQDPLPWTLPLTPQGLGKPKCVLGTKAD